MRPAAAVDLAMVEHDLLQLPDMLVDFRHEEAVHRDGQVSQGDQLSRFALVCG